MNKQAFVIVRTIVVYTLCLFYSVKAILLLTYLFVNGGWRTKFWRAKERPTPPKCLTTTKWGEHNYIRVNVSILVCRDKNKKSINQNFIKFLESFCFSFFILKITFIVMRLSRSLKIKFTPFFV